MQGNLQALLDGVYPLEQREIATLYDQARLLARLVDDLRELSLADAGYLPLRIQTVGVLPLLQAVVTQMASVAEAQNVCLEVQAHDRLPEVRADPERLAQIVRNLLANALHHTPAGGRISLAATSETCMHFRVCDTGEGIATEDLPHVFEHFYRANKAHSRMQGNTGLGLAICLAWAKAMGGQMGVESTMGQGSCFWFTLPLAKQKGCPEGGNSG